MGSAIDVSPVFAAIIAVFLIAFLWREYRSRPAEDGPEGEPYRVYAREFDLVVAAADALRGLETVSPDSDRGWLKGSAPAVAGAVSRLDEVLARQRAALWIDRKRWVQRLREAANDVNARDAVVTILIDQSGSMQGQPITAVAAAVTLLVEIIGEFGAKCEVLGFSTAGWHGGYAYEKWKKSGRPARPGRLCALRHIVYKSADEPSLTETARQTIVHPDLLRENVDGEALLWASERLSACPASTKILIVLSDGAPVDDATLMHNGLSYLHRHLGEVLRQLASRHGLKIGAIGLNHRVDDVYPVALTPANLDEVPRAGVEILEKLLSSSASGEGDG